MVEEGTLRRDACCRQRLSDYARSVLNWHTLMASLWVLESPEPDSDIVGTAVLKDSNRFHIVAFSSCCLAVCTIKRDVILIQTGLSLADLARPVILQ